MKRIALLFMPLLAVLATSCIVISHPVVAAESSSSANFSPGKFDAVNVSGAIDATFEQTSGSDYLVEVEAPVNLLPLVRVEARGSVLYVGLKNGTKVSTNGKKITAVIRAPRLTAATLSGASNLKVPELNTTTLSVTAGGASDVSFHRLRADRLKVVVSGASDANISGEVPVVSYHASGASDVKAYGLRAQQVEVNCSGSSDIHCTATKSLTGSASGSSDVKYKGCPDKVQVSTSGASDCRPMEKK